MNRKTKLSENQPYAPQDKLVYEEIYECKLQSLDSLELCIAQIKKDFSGHKFNFKIETKENNCIIKFERMGKDTVFYPIEPIPVQFIETISTSSISTFPTLPALTSKDLFSLLSK
jgi:hypothetical protein